jgi:hypothetical protein
VTAPLDPAPPESETPTATDPSPDGPDGSVPAAAPRSVAHEPGYEERRNVMARDKGLPGEVIEGGEDPRPAEGLREERYYGRLLVGMVVVLILGGFVLGIVIALAQS